jgi:hypothetical protein
MSLLVLVGGRFELLATPAKLVMPRWAATAESKGPLIPCVEPLRVGIAAGVLVLNLHALQARQSEALLCGSHECGTDACALRLDSYNEKPPVAAPARAPWRLLRTGAAADEDLLSVGGLQAKGQVQHAIRVLAIVAHAETL